MWCKNHNHLLADQGNDCITESVGAMVNDVITIHSSQLATGSTCARESYRSNGGLTCARDITLCHGE